MDLNKALVDFPLDFHVWEGNIFPSEVDSYASDGKLFFDLRAVEDADCRLHLREKPFRAVAYRLSRPWPYHLSILWSYLPTDLSRPLTFCKWAFLGDGKAVYCVLHPFANACPRRLKLALHLLQPDRAFLGGKKGKKQFKVIWFFKNQRPIGCLAAMVDEPITAWE